VAGVQVFFARVSETNDAFEAHNVEGNECRNERQRKTPGPCGAGRFEMIA
jgi:hypothetical protein